MAISNNSKIIALIGQTASGKSALASDLAREYGLDIFCLDSLSIYKDINIFSAKPSAEIRREIVHFGLDMLEIEQKCNAKIFFDLLQNALAVENRGLIIVGGSSFFLKSIINGLSIMPNLTEEKSAKMKEALKNIDPFELLKQIEPDTKINRNDHFRIHKSLEIYFATNLAPSAYFRAFPPVPLLISLGRKIDIYNLKLDKEKLKNNIKKRLEHMLEMGAICEIEDILKAMSKDDLALLREDYDAFFAKFPALKSIGAREAISFLQGKIDLQELKDQIFYHTCQLAKRQGTFNRTQFQNVTSGSAKELKLAISRGLKSI
ncbi:MAG: tRNA (adenosine(37)-N6)-dimethylallyltransferase MiaA [Helicobacter sp.]|nr:tRNA (adenosine(37)-N6)-dimethylallyltransferase MiaA [Helicobacter sp.]